MGDPKPTDGAGGEKKANANEDQSGAGGSGAGVQPNGPGADGQQIEAGSGPQPNEGQINKIALPRLPPFFRGRPVMWFMQVDLMFRRARITSDNSKFEEVACQLEPDMLFELEDFFTGPAENLTYEKLKERIITQHSHSETKRIQVLLQELRLDDKKPSTLLREMRSNSGTAVSEEFLKNLWMQRLPAQMQSILAVHTGPINELAEQADKIAEINIGPSAFSISAGTSKRSESNDELSDLKKMVASLLKKVNDISNAGQRQSRSRSKSDKSRSASRSPSRKMEDAESNTLCYYHNRFGDKATKCRKPCSFSKSEN